jgi:ligand-binding SRPBCC domain-containing protein
MVSVQWDSLDRCFVLRASVLLQHSRETLFEFFSDAFQLEKITPAWLNFRILTPAPIQICQGCLIDYSIRLHGIPMRWQTEISAWDPPFSFTDRQVSGPYQLWEHLHTFETVSEGTLAVDEVRYRVLGGRLVNRWFVRKELQRIFEFRQKKMLELFPVSGFAATEEGMIR